MSKTHFVMLAILISLVGCAGRKAGWDQSAEQIDISREKLSELRAEAKELWEKRVEQKSLVEALRKFEQIAQANPQDLEAFIYLTRGHYFLADSHLQEIEQKKKTYERAASFGEKAMATNPAFQEQVKNGKSVEEALASLTVKEVPAIYWTAASLGKWAKASGIAAALKYKTRIKAMIERVGQLSPDYFYGAVPRYWGGFYAVAPSFAGGDMKKSLENFSRSLAIAPGYLGTKVLMAEVYWTKQGNKAEFQKALTEVLKTKDDVIPELTPENVLEKAKAKRLLAQTEDLF